MKTFNGGGLDFGREISMDGELRFLELSGCRFPAKGNFFVWPAARKRIFFFLSFFLFCKIKSRKKNFNGLSDETGCPPHN